MSSNPILSVIICSVNADKLASTVNNLRRNSGIPIEILSLDNNKLNWSICKVYNYLAQQASAEYILFIHEDVHINTYNWGPVIIQKLSDRNTGVIGFAGSMVHTKACSGWVQAGHKGAVGEVKTPESYDENLYVSSIYNVKFQSVISIDGLAMFVRKEVWSKIRFDDALLHGFHGYDLDFSLHTSIEYTNYVVTGLNVFHFSKGCFNEAWLLATIFLQKKWHRYLPMCIQDCERKINIPGLEADNDYLFLLRVRTSKLQLRIKMKIYITFLKNAIIYKPYRDKIMSLIRG